MNALCVVNKTLYHYRVIACLENLEMSIWNLAAVTEMSGILLNVREVLGKILSGKKWPKPVYCT